MGISGMLGATVGNSIATLIGNIAQPLRIAVVAVLALMAAAAVVFAIYVAFRLAKAEDDGKRKEAKQQLLWSVVAVVAAIGIFVLIQVVFVLRDLTVFRLALRILLGKARKVYGEHGL